MISISSGALTAVVGLVGVLLGTLIGPYINHKLTLKNTRKDLLFKRKLEYFEKLSENIEENIRTYRNAITETENASKERTEEIYNKLKEERKNFLIMASPLYFNIHELSERIVCFVEEEKKIFNEFNRLIKSKSQKQRQNAKKELKEMLKSLRILGNQAIYEMRKELGK